MTSSIYKICLPRKIWLELFICVVPSACLYIKRVSLTKTWYHKLVELFFHKLPTLLLIFLECYPLPIIVSYVIYYCYTITLNGLNCLLMSLDLVKRRKDMQQANSLTSIIFLCAVNMQSVNVNSLRTKKSGKVLSIIRSLVKTLNNRGEVYEPWRIQLWTANYCEKMRGHKTNIHRHRIIKKSYAKTLGSFCTNYEKNKLLFMY